MANKYLSGLATVAGAVIALTASTPATAQAEDYKKLKGNAANGKKVFVQRQACHAQQPGVNRVGPSLHNVVGRKARTVPGFKYSKGNQSSGVVWTEENLFVYLKAPRNFIKGTTMAFAGIPDAQKRADLIAYLKTNGKI